MSFSALECMISITNVKHKMYCIWRFSNPSQILSLEIIPKIFLKFILYYKIHSHRKKRLYTLKAST